MADATAQLTTSQVEEDHVRLKAVMVSINQELDREISQAEFSEWKTSFLLSLRDFQSQLLKHFDLEEDGGFIEDMKRIAPQWMSRIEGVVDDHEEIRKELREIIRDFKKCHTLARVGRTSCKQRIRDLISTLIEHEREETDLIQMAHNQVYGAGD